MIELKVLDKTKDENLFLQSWEWQFTKPKRWQELFAIWKESKEEYLAKRFDSLQTDIGIFFDGDFIGLITLDETYPTVFEAHFNCKQLADADKLTEAICIARDHVFKNGAKLIYVFIAQQNRTMRKIILPVGFYCSNIEILFGQLRGKVVSWKQYRLKNPID